MKVVFWSYDTDNYVGGVGWWLTRLLPAMAAQGVEVSAELVSFSPPGGIIGRTLINRGIRVHWHKTEYYTDVLVHRLRQFLSCAPEIVVVNHVLPMYYLVPQLRKLGLRTVAVLHSDDVYYHGILDQMFVRHPCFSCDGVVGVSRYLADLASRAVSCHTLVKEIGYGVPRPSNRASWTNSNDETFRLLFVGRLVQEQKRIKDVVRTMIRAIREVQGVEGDIIGDGPDRREVEVMIEESGCSSKLRLHGMMPADLIQEFYGRAQALLLLSDYEGLPITLLEAMLCGVVPICTKMRSGIDELVSDGVTGIIVGDRGNSVIAAINVLRNDAGYWLKLSEESIARITKSYLIDTCAIRWKVFLEQIVHRESSKGCGRRMYLPRPHPDLRNFDRRQGVFGWRRYLKRIAQIIRNPAGLHSGDK